MGTSSFSLLKRQKGAATPCYAASSLGGLTWWELGGHLSSGLVGESTLFLYYYRMVPPSYKLVYKPQ